MRHTSEYATMSQWYYIFNPYRQIGQRSDLVFITDGILEHHGSYKNHCQTVLSTGISLERIFISIRHLRHTQTDTSNKAINDHAT